jgi:hypothetical protein
MADTANRAYAAAHFGLELDQKDEVGLFRSIEGGGVKADVMTYQPAPSKEIGGYQKWRQLGKPKFEDIKMQIGMSMSASFYTWISDFMKGEPNRKSGAILAADFYYKERARREFSEAMIKELTIPKLDATDKNPVYMGVTLAVEDIKFLKGTGKALDKPKGFDAQKQWTACNFNFFLNGFDDHLKRVTKIDSFTVKQNIAEYHAGGFKAAIKTPTAIEYPNIAFYIPEADAQPFYDRLQTQVGFGKREGNGTVRNAAELSGRITMNDAEGMTLMEIAFDGAQVLSVTPDKQDSGSEEIRQVKIELYTEGMELKYMGLE